MNRTDKPEFIKTENTNVKTFLKFDMIVLTCQGTKTSSQMLIYFYTEIAVLGDFSSISSWLNKKRKMDLP